MASTEVAKQFRIVPYAMRRISREKVFISLPDGSSALVLPGKTAEMLTTCDIFRTIEAHAERFWARLSHVERVKMVAETIKFFGRVDPGQPLGRRAFRPLQESLHMLARLGYLVDLDTFAGVGKPVPPQAADGRITTIGFATRDRPEQLRRSIESYQANAKTYGRTVEFAICDDSKSTKLEKVLVDISQTAGARINYAGRAEKEAFIKRLEEKGIPEEVLRYCFFGPEWPAPTYGANRNALLLQTVGEMAFSADDDTVCRVSRSRGMRDGLRLGDKAGFVKEVWTFPTREEAFKSVIPVPMDFLAEHEAVLATSVAAYLQRRMTTDRPRLDTTLLDDDFMESIAAGVSKATVSVNGAVGDSGRNDPTFLLFLHGESRARVMRSELDFRSAMYSREMIRTTDVTTIFESNVVGSMFFGYDNRDILPPFFPIFRSEDALWGRLIHLCVTGSCFAQLPWLMAHEAEARAGYSDPHGERKDIRPYDVIAAAADNLGFKHLRAATSEKLTVLGTFVKDLGSMPTADFKHNLRIIRGTKLINAVSNCMKALEEYPGSPRYWLEAVQKSLKIYEDALKSPGTGMPPDVTANRTEDEAIDVYRHLIYRFGEMLVWWPYIVNAAKELKQEGIRLGRPVGKAG